MADHHRNIRVGGKIPLVSIVISTRDRGKKIRSCISSILKGSYTHFEIIVVDQSQNDSTEVAVMECRDRRIRYTRVFSKGISCARNAGITLSRGTYIAFTDDDCIVGKEWLERIVHRLSGNALISGVFGTVMPYKKSRSPSSVSPAYFLPKKMVLHTRPLLHSMHIGIGNNMAFRRVVFREVGYFRNWLGPGSVGGGADDAEMILRVIVRGLCVCTDPEILVYHDRWVAGTEIIQQTRITTRGEAACYLWFGLYGYKFGLRVIRNLCVRATRESVFAVYDKIREKRMRIYTLKRAYALIVGCIEGIALAVFYRLVLFRKNNIGYASLAT